ncbi:hypothetical protein BRD09_04555 [Halobacteriales archaeon SW_10_68_16]|nr:MAG: hypothetical protein BRD09_04555 [Halobacteriales archaeon SW_10_68_16]
MDVHDEWIPEAVFGECIDRLPQVCVEVVLTHDGSIDVDVPVAIPRDTWEDVVKADTDDADPNEVTPADGLDVTLDDQHDDWRLLTERERGLHEYVEAYLDAYDLLG